MTPAAELERLLKAYGRYYDVNADHAAPPFAAEAAFHSHDEQYFLVKSARLAEAESHEYVFFALCDTVTAADAARLDLCAWQRGLARVRPHKDHRSTDIVLIILAEHIDPEARDFLRRSRHYQSYRFTLQGWSHYRVVALETVTGALTCNRQGRALCRLFRNTKKWERK